MELGFGFALILGINPKSICIAIVSLLSDAMAKTLSSLSAMYLQNPEAVN